MTDDEDDDGSGSHSLGSLGNDGGHAISGWALRRFTTVIPVYRRNCGRQWRPPTRFSRQWRCRILVHEIRGCKRPAIRRAGNARLNCEWVSDYNAVKLIASRPALPYRRQTAIAWFYAGVGWALEVRRAWARVTILRPF